MGNLFVRVAQQQRWMWWHQRRREGGGERSQHAQHPRTAGLGSLTRRMYAPPLSARQRRIQIDGDADKDDFIRNIVLLDILDIWCEEVECHQNMKFIAIRIHKLIFFVTQNNLSGKYKNKIISNISIGILIFISIFNGFSANHIQVPYRGTGVTSLTPSANP